MTQDRFRDMTKQQLIEEIERLEAGSSSRLTAERKLLESEERYRELFEHMGNAVAVYEAVDEGKDFVFRDFNHAAAAIEQVSIQSVLGKRVTEVFPGIVEFGLLEVFERVWRTGQPESHPISFYQDDRVVGWCENVVYCLPNGEIVAIYDDLTEQKQAESVLQYHSMLLEHLSDAVVSTDEDHVITSWNKAAERIYGFSEAEAIGKSTSELVQAEYVSETREAALEHLFETGEWSGDTLQQAKGGRPLEMATSIQLIRDVTGRLLGAVGIHRDVGDQRRLEAKLAQSERLASIGLLAAGVAHEINNPLTHVMYSLGRLVEYFHHVPGREVAVSAELLDLAEGALVGTERIAAIAHQLHTFSRVGDGGPSEVQVNELVETALRFADNEIRFRARVEKQLGNLPTLLVHGGKLAQILLNLLINAAHSIDEGDRENNLITIRTWIEDGQLAISISDTGRGIPGEHLDQIFDPFFTTKAVGRGSGLGLWVCSNFVSNLGGSVEAQSVVGEGSQFVVRLPCVEPDHATRSDQIGQAKLPGPKRRLLLVDDEVTVVMVIKAMLKDRHELVVAHSGEEAIAELEDRERFDGVICDLMMPGLTGMDVHAFLRDRGDELADRMLFVSGGAFTPRAKEFLASVPNPKLLKPFKREDLLAGIRLILD